MSQDNSTNEAIGQRLEAFRHSLHLSRKEFARDTLKVSDAYYGQMARGTRGMSTKVLINLVKAQLGLNIDWLLAGEGEMLASPMTVQLEAEKRQLMEELQEAKMKNKIYKDLIDRKL